MTDEAYTTPAVSENRRLCDKSVAAMFGCMEVGLDGVRRDGPLNEQQHRDLLHVEAEMKLLWDRLLELMAVSYEADAGPKVISLLSPAPPKKEVA